MSLTSVLEKGKLHGACGNLLIPHSLIMAAVPSFVHQHSVRSSWSIFEHGPH